MPTTPSDANAEPSRVRFAATGEVPSVPPDYLLEARLAIPRRRSGTLRRTRLLRLLRSAQDRRVISIVAPPGYGKTSLLAQWATEGPRPVAWLTANDRDNDPVVLLSDLAVAIDRVVPLGLEHLAAIASGTMTSWTAVSRLLGAMSGHPERVRIAVDDAHRITSRACLDAIAELAAHLPEGCQVGIAGRARIRLPFARWRADGSLLEIGPAELAIDEHEAVGLGRELGLRLTTETATELTRQTQGWPALLVLATLGARSVQGRTGSIEVGPDDLVSDYLRAEVLESRSRAEIDFLTRTSILERITGALCDVVLDRRGSNDVLEHLARSTLLIDEYGRSYRYHALLRDFLQRELAVREPDRIRPLHRRAAAWYRENGAIELAIDHAFAADDVDLAATMVGQGFVPYHWSGRRETIRAWARRFGDHSLEERPWLSVLAAWEEIAAGDAAGAAHFADIAERGTSVARPADGTASSESGRSMLRAAMALRGAADAMANAARAVELEAAGGAWRDFALWQLAFARITMGDLAGADAALADAIDVARSSSNAALRYCLVGHRALVAVERGAWDLAAALVDERHAIATVARVEEYLSATAARIASVRLEIQRGDMAGARRDLVRATTLRPLLTAATPGGSVQLLLGLARAHLAVDDPAGARALLVQAADVIRQRPDLGVLPGQVDSLRATVASLPPSRGGGASSLTVAELRVLGLLPYYLSFKEIGQRLGVKETTVKSQALSIYGKLGAATRGDAVDLATTAGLLERFRPVTPAAEPRRQVARG